MEAPGSGEQQGGRSRRHRRSLSCPTSLESLCEQALSLETTPCSVLQLNSLEDDVAVALRRTLHETQREILRAVEAGVLSSGSGSGGGGGRAASGGRRTTSDSGGAASDVEERQRSGGAASGSAATDAHQQDECLLDEAELEGLSAKERELAIKRARNREAARRSRERKVERIVGLQAEVDALRNNNFVLLKCIEEVAQKALAARAEQKQLRDKLSQVQSQAAAPQPAAAVPASAACTPPAAQRAAALERDLRQMEAASPTRLLLPHWPGSGDVAAPAASAPAAMLYHPRPHLPTSAELRRQLQEAVAGGLGGSLGGGSGGSSGHNSAGSSGEKKAADREHHLHPSPQRVHGALLEPAAAAAILQQQVQPHAALLQLRQEGQGLLRSCSAPGGLLAGTAAGLSVVEGAGPPPTIDWFRGVAA
ncbi:Transcription factor AP-1 [Chlorella sorokiniana]|jgi:hypothetical protein|uniref:Transcription factor AP-1 n=1 Tax=Chlorella sorokiniana TaxID=3076 RepID=A0A2P6U2M9_CHLSO|nr:Transcription factor AP-1 [Chlorella sorokiniana]|eukprot:PRW60569.1 Transcription factor AP-1 [Chlorella sorokiniana]